MFKLSLLLLSRLRSNNPIVLGPDNANLPKIFLIIADGVANESVKSEDACSKRLANVIRQVQVSARGDSAGEDSHVRGDAADSVVTFVCVCPQVSAGLWTQCVSTLNETQQKAVQELLNTA